MYLEVKEFLFSKTNLSMGGMKQYLVLIIVLHQLFNFYKLYVKYQIGVRWNNVPCPSCTVTQRRGYHQPALTPGFHTDHSDVPTFYNFVRAELK